MNADSKCMFCRGTGETISFDQDWGTVLSNCSNCGGGYILPKNFDFKYLDYAIGLVTKRAQVGRVLTASEEESIKNDCIVRQKRRIR